MLIGMNFMHQYSINPLVADDGYEYMIVKSAHGAGVPLESVRRRAQQPEGFLVSKMTVITPGHSAQVHVRHAKLQKYDPYDAIQTCQFTSEAYGVVDHVCTLDTLGMTPEVSWVTVVNSMDAPMRLMRKQKVGQLTD